MKILAILREEEIYKDIVPTPEENYGPARSAVRVVLFDEDKNVALGEYGRERNLPISYLIPGGGIDDGEEILEALKREYREETGCEIKNIQELGIIHEYGVGKEVKHFQENYCFTDEVDGEKGVPQFTQDEIENGLELVWLPLDKAIEEIEKQDKNFGKAKTLILLKEVRRHVFNHKLYIIGGLGSGKSYLAKKLSESTHSVHYDLDRIVFINSLFKERGQEERDTIFASRCNEGHWVIEGTYTEDWIKLGLEKADVIIYLNIHPLTRFLRFIKRIWGQGILQQQNLYGRSLLVLGFKYKEYDRTGKGYRKLLERYRDKVVVLKSEDDVNNYLHSIRI